MCHTNICQFARIYSTCIYSTCRCTHTVENTGLPLLNGDHSVLTLSRALGLPCLLNSIWKHNERMTGITTLTSKLLHQCFHPLAFSFSTHHFPLLCSWETMTTSESGGWSYMKAAEGVEPTVMWLALSPKHTRVLVRVAPPTSSFLFHFSSIPTGSLFCFLSGEPVWSFTSNFHSQCIIKREHNYFTIYVALSAIAPRFRQPPTTTTNVWTHTYTHGCPPSRHGPGVPSVIEAPEADAN